MPTFLTWFDMVSALFRCEGMKIKLGNVSPLERLLRPQFWLFLLRRKKKRRESDGVGEGKMFCYGQI